MSDIRIKMAKDLRDMSDMVGDLHWMAAKAVEDLIKKDARIADLEARASGGTNGDKYKAELYDEVWGKATGMGYSNVTMALAELAAIKAQGVVMPRLGKFKTSEGGRSYVAEFFKTALQRHDFTTYINERLAADFACALADGLYQLNAAPVQQVSVPDDLAAQLYEIAGQILGSANAKCKAVSHTLMAPKREYTLADAQRVARLTGERLASIADCLNAAPAAPAADAGLVEALEKVKAAALIDDPHDHYDMVCDALSNHKRQKEVV